MRGISLDWLAGAAAIALGVQLGACGNSLQPRDEVRVRVGLGPEQAERAAPFAALYLPYAMMSSLAYTRAEKLNVDLCPDPASFSKGQDDAAASAWMRSLQARNWRCVFGLSEMRPCPRRYPNCRPFDGPDLQVWRRNASACGEVVIAYRGVNLRDPTDWPSLRWMLKLPRFGEDPQIDGMLAASGCGAATKVIAVGHSLGGRHAEEAAYANGRIRYVYAFNNAHVFGFVDPATRARNQKGLGIDRVHEAGDLLTVSSVFWPASSCNPRIRIVQFNLTPVGLPIMEHNINTLTANMVEVARGNGKSALAYRDAARCMAGAAR